MYTVLGSHFIILIVINKDNNRRSEYTASWQRVIGTEIGGTEHRGRLINEDNYFNSI